VTSPTSKQEIVWVDGVPKAVSERAVFTKSNAANLLSEISKECLNFPYDGPDTKYAGMSKGEAIIAQLVDSAASGNADARKELLDRVMGKPQQNIKSVSLRGSLGDFLDDLDTSEADVIDL